MMEKACALGQNPKLPQQPTPASLPTSSAAGCEACASVGEICLLGGLHLAMGGDKCLIGLGITGMLYFL